jgi:membrane protein DedA with SNARE-associated domain
VLLSGTVNPLLLGIVAGAGGALGKVTSYFLGRFGYLIVGDKSKGNLNALHDAMARYGMLGVFVFSVTPLPDDVYVIPMGIIRLPFWRFFLANLAGKILLSVGVAYLGSAYLSTLDQFLGADSVLVIILAVGLTALLSVLIVRADWVSAVEIAQKGGLRALIARMPEILRLKRKEES